MSYVRSSPEEDSPLTASEESEAGDFENGGDVGVEDEEEDDDDAVDEDEDEDEEDSGMGSDELDVTELGEAGSEMCQVGEQSVAVPLDLYDLGGLGEVLSLDAWNTVLSEEDRLRLATLLPDVDQETFARTLVELLRGDNFHFGSPLAALFDRLKGGLCDPRIVLYRRGTRFAERRKHYYRLQSYHNSMVRGLWEVKDCWKGCQGYGLNERLRALDAMKLQQQQQMELQKQNEEQQQKQKELKQQKTLGLDDWAGSETDSESREYGEPSVMRLKPDRTGLKKSGKFGKERSKGLLRVGVPKGLGEEYIGGAGRDAAMALSELSRQDNTYDYDLGVLHRGKLRRSLESLDSEELGNNRDLQRIRPQRQMSNPGKKELAASYDGNLYGNNYHENHNGSYYYGRNATANQGVTVAAAYDRPYFDTTPNAKYSERDWMYGGQCVPSKALKGDEMDWPAGSHVSSMNDWQGGQSAGDYRSRKAQAGHGLKVKSYKSIEEQINDANFGSDPRSKISQGKIKGKSSSQYDGIGQKYSRSSAAYTQSEETESDSSEQFEGGGDILLKKQPEHHSGSHRPAYSAKKSKKPPKASKLNYPTATEDFEPYQSKGSHRGKVAESDHLRDVHVMATEQISEMMRPPAARGERKRKVMASVDTYDYGNSELHGSNENADESLRSPENDLKLASGSGYVDTNGDFEKRKIPLSSCSSGSKKQKGRVEATSLDEHAEDVPSAPKLVENSGSSKKKGKRKLEAVTDAVAKKKPEAVTDAVAKMKAEDVTDAVAVAEPAPVLPEENVAVVEPEKPKKKYVPITPTIHTGFSFSIVHLLTAVRKAMATPIEDTPLAAKQLDGEDSTNRFNNVEQSKASQDASATEQAQQNHEVADASGLEKTQQGHESADASAAEQTAPSNLPALTVQEIVSRIKSNPGDPNILETQEPLQDLVRGVLKILSSRTAPLGAKGWKALVSYDKSNKSWLWVGPLPSGSTDGDPNEETSPDAWGIPHKMLVKLVDAFANWLKSGQETLKQIGSLPPPPAPDPANLDLKERFKDLRAQKSLNTISPSSEEARSYFQREEFLRYSIPDRAFCYTAADGEKSIVAPLRRGGGKPTAKARGHPMLLPDRPPHVTILCLVRDAASRLPARTGTRADVCTLLKDSQYLNHDESNKEAAVNQVVSGALDRLHYERDPCVLYDNDKKLWTYLHRGREEEDFEDDGTSSTKKWKRPRKDSDPAEPGMANDDLEDDGTPLASDAKKQKTDFTASGEDKDGEDPVIQDPSAGDLEGDPDPDH
uniref:DEUBAD domain-containing protein n=1 Tax=Leersia perrieri TaxID=77586 RepID=A0A0D9WC40_9ORYZ